MNRKAERSIAPDPSYSVPVASKMLKVGQAQLRAAIRRGEVKAFTINGRDRIPGEWLEKQLRAE